jgi:hypothetical protein
MVSKVVHSGFACSNDKLECYLTVTDLANSCVTPLFRRPQGSQGCLEKQNHPLRLNLVVWCAKDWAQNQENLKSPKIDQNNVKNDEFLTVFLKFPGF